MKHLIRLIVVLAFTGIAAIPAASAAERMWMGFHDDPVFRWDNNRMDELLRWRRPVTYAVQIVDAVATAHACALGCKDIADDLALTVTDPTHGNEVRELAEAG